MPKLKKKVLFVEIPEDDVISVNIKTKKKEKKRIEESDEESSSDESSDELETDKKEENKNEIMLYDESKYSDNNPMEGVYYDNKNKRYWYKKDTKKEYYSVSKYGNKEEAKIKICEEYKKVLLSELTLQVFEKSNVDQVQTVIIPDTEIIKTIY
jgi:hypothetical protein